jgi:hypothetical protein
MRRLFVGTFEDRVDVCLLVDGLDDKIPLQYRYLSLYKILERHFKRRGKWQKTLLDSFLSRFAHLPGAVKDKGTSARHLHALRDLCAHIKTNRDTEGVTQLNQKDTEKVANVMPFLAEVCVTLLNEKAGGRFTISRTRPTSE